jgi:hypothetical protein
MENRVGHGELLIVTAIGQDDGIVAEKKLDSFFVGRNPF